jgi:hypothetical protein
VRRQGLEPRTGGLRGDRLAALGARPAQTASLPARNAQNAPSGEMESFHEAFHAAGPSMTTASERAPGGVLHPDLPMSAKRELSQGMPDRASTE